MHAIEAKDVTSSAPRAGVPGLSLVCGLGSAVLALGFDVVFMKYPAGWLGYLWYLTTVASFGGGAFVAARSTLPAARRAVLGILLGFGALYGALDIALAMFLQQQTFSGALFGGVLGAAIACISVNAGFTRGRPKAPLPEEH